MPNNNLPPYAEEQKQLINEEQLSLQEILSQFQQPIPSGFIPLQVEHICSTKPKWEGKPLSERYSFTHGEKWIWIDIPHTLMETLGLEKGEEITQPLYLDPQVLTRPKTYKGIDIKDGEIFIQHSFTIQNLEKDIAQLFELIEDLKKEKEEKRISQEQTKHLQSDIQRLDQEKEQLTQRIKELENLDADSKQDHDRELTRLRTQLNILEKSFKEAQTIDQQVYDILGQYSQQKEPLLRSQEVVQKINILTAERDSRPNISLAQWNNDYSKRPTHQELIALQKELDQEKGWLDKWINDNREVFGEISDSQWKTKVCFTAWLRFNNDDVKWEGIRFWSEKDSKKMARAIKNLVHTYYI